MKFIFYSLGFWVFAVLGHGLWCRRHPGSGLALKPFVAFAGLAGAGLFVLLASTGGFSLSCGFCGIMDIPLGRTAGVLFFLLNPLYLIFYFGTKVESPSAKIVALIRQHQRLSLVDFKRLMTNEALILPRLNDLSRLNYVTLDETKRYSLTVRGVRVARFLNLYEKLSGRRLGG